MAHKYDATLKSRVAQHPDDFASVFGLPTEGPVQAINVDLSTLSAATDVALAYGQPIREIVGLNFQTGPDPALPARLHLYNAALHSRFEVAVGSILVLLRSKADAANLTGKLRHGRPQRRIEFEYDVVRVCQLPVEACLSARISALPLSTLCRLPEGQPLPEALREVVREIDRRLGREASDAEAERLMMASYILSSLRVPKSDLGAIFGGIEIVEQLTAWDEAVESGVARGRAEGRTEGELARSYRLLLRLGRKRFGKSDPLIEAELARITDLDRLERMADAILTVKSWQELLATV